MNHTGIIPGVDTHDRAVRAAGAFAELGATRLFLECPGQPRRELRARTTDLPSLIASSEGCLLASPELGIDIQVLPTSLTWTARDQRAATVWQAALGAQLHD